MTLVQTVYNIPVCAGDFQTADSRSSSGMNRGGVFSIWTDWLLTKTKWHSNEVSEVVEKVISSYLGKRISSIWLSHLPYDRMRRY